MLAGTCLEAARALIGTRLVRDDPDGERRVGRIVEVEAYGGVEDRASHARFGPTDRNRVMFGPPGIAYVYLVYGMYDCLNVVAGPEGQAAAVLLRAVEPLEGVEAMRRARLQLARRSRRGAAQDGESARIARLPSWRLASGPGLLGAAFGVERRHDGTDLCDVGSVLHLEPPAAGGGPSSIAATPRIGIDRAGEPWTTVRWRLVDAGSPSVSGPRRAT